MSMWKENDIITVFGNPIKLEHPIGQARLVKKISDCNDSKTVEYWEVEYLNDEGHTYPALIRKHGKN